MQMKFFAMIQHASIFSLFFNKHCPDQITLLMNRNNADEVKMDLYTNLW